MLLFARTPVDGTYVADLLPAMLLVGIGAGLCFPALMTLAMSGATPSDAGLASGLVNTSAQVGGAIGLAVLGDARRRAHRQPAADGEAAMTRRSTPATTSPTSSARSSWPPRWRSPRPCCSPRARRSRLRPSASATAPAAMRRTPWPDHLSPQDTPTASAVTPGARGDALPPAGWAPAA